ncbi:ABC transporter permease [Aridibaculum aurantiacum]|uniref:ABC transporter permease n=1 Tax=Aridibaculum aurantiacum TaxID=2810307 RepID=UPI001A96BB6C|nr:ABC transporter permease [Aridibaculum aurantiacum]
MIKNYLKIALRNLWRNKAFSFINIAGLAVGMAACFLIFMYVTFEKSYDTFHSKSSRIYRVLTDVITPSETIHAGITAWPFAPNIKTDFPEVEAFVRVNATSMLIKKDNRKFQEDRVLYADSSFFRVFDFKLVKGNAETALKEQLSLVLSETTAKKYFGNADPIGQTVVVTGSEFNAIVTGVMEDLPENSHLKADVLVSMATLTEKFSPGLDEQWSNFDAVSYLLLKPGTDPGQLEKKFPAFLEQRAGKLMKENQMFYTLFLEPLKDVYMNAERDDAFENGNRNNVLIFSIIAVFILFIACINFVNLTTARSAERAKEVGIRKVVGAEKNQLVNQFLGESLVMSLLAFVIAIGIAALLLPLFNELAGKTVSTGIFSNINHVLLLLAASIAIGLLAGVYPALVLSAFKPIIVLKGKFTTGTRGIMLRKGLVVAQFSISIALIIGTIVVYHQMKYMRNQDLGFSKDQVIVLDTHGNANKFALKEELQKLPQVTSAALSSSIPGGSNSKAYSEIENAKGEMQIANVDLYFVDFEYIEQFKMKTIAGRTFSRDFGTDTTQAMVINEAAVKFFGYTSAKDAVGKRFSQWGREGTIIGVVKNFHYRSLQENIAPLSMRIEPSRSDLLSIKVSSAQLPATIAALENTWKTIMPHRPFSYYFLDEFFDRQYRGEERFGTLFLYFAVLAIFISCLGLLGLAAYSTIQRTKEIGIRKVMGASIPNIVHLLSKEFLLLVAIAFLVAAPIAWYFMYQWLEGFAYRTTISWWIFLSAGVIAFLIASVTTSFHAIKASVSNPIKSLRTE